MDFDDVTPKVDDAINQVLKEDLSSHSIDELEERIANLVGEIERVKELIKSKNASRDAADSVFN